MLSVLSMSIQDNIKLKLDDLEKSLINGQHLAEPLQFEKQLASISIYFHLMSDEDRDYVNCARTAFEDGIEWII